MKNVISYVLFGDHPRYWSSIPFILIANDLIHGDMISRFHLPLSAKNHIAFPILDELSKNGKVEIRFIDRPYKNTEPTIWRIMPLWDAEVTYFFCRDVDAVPSSLEKKAVVAFMRSGHAIHGIRSWWTHSTTLMAGLCGFNAKKTRMYLLRQGFEHYRNFGVKSIPHYCADWQWGCDQHLLHRYFLTGRNGMIFRRSFLDTRLGDAPDLKKIFKFQPLEIPPNIYADIDISHINKEILEICDSLVRFLGEPMTITPDILKKALKIECTTSKVIQMLFQTNTKLAEFYGINNGVT